MADITFNQQDAVFSHDMISFNGGFGDLWLKREEMPDTWIKRPE